MSVMDLAIVEGLVGGATPGTGGAARGPGKKW
jgi:hypothetical protein